MALLDAVESAGRFIVANTPMPAIHSFPSPANLTLSFTNRIPKFSSLPHRVPDLRAEGAPFDPGYLSGSHTRARSHSNCKAAAATLLLVQPIASPRALST
jgi:hypothetical protein